MKRRRPIVAIVLGAALVAGGALLPARGLAPVTATAAAEDTLEYLEADFAAAPEEVAVATELGFRYLAEVKSNADPRFYPKAEAAFLAALKSDPQSFEATYGMAALAAGRHDFVSALSWSRKAIVLNEYNSDAWGIRTDSLIELGRYGAAADALQRMVDLKPGLSSFARVSYLRELNGDLVGARRAMKRALQSAGSPDDAAFAAFHVGELYLAEDRVAEAEQWYSRAVELGPESSIPIVGLAKIAALEGDLDRAIELIQGLLDSNEEPGHALFLGDLLRATDDEAGAEGAYELADSLLDRETQNGSNVKLEEALVAADEGRSQAALRSARSEYRTRQSIHVADAYAWALYSSGKLTKARQLSREALRLGTRSALFHFHAGMIALGLDDRVGAMSHLDTALSLNPAFSLQHRETAERVLRCLRSTCGEGHR